MAKQRQRWVNISYLICDREYLRSLASGGADRSIHLATPLQTLRLRDRGQFQDGPVCPRVAVLDFDAETGRLRPGVKFVPQGIGKTVSKYALDDTDLGPGSSPEAFETDAFLQLSPFATVLKTLEFFESREILGRPVTWAFPSRQLLVIPRAGELRNAFYERESGSLQFFFERSAAGHMVYTALSHDIVAHETTHAILDGLAPDLYHAVTPQSLALHEAIADLAAITQKLLNEMVLFSLDMLTGPRPEDEAEVLSRIAEEFGSDLRLTDGANFLRRLKNRRTLDTRDRSVDAFGQPNAPDVTDHHALSTVLSGAVYRVFEERMNATKTGRQDARADTLDERFAPAARRVARITFRALDFMPPGEVSFLDYGRAFVAAAQATYARPQREQRWLRDEFVKRGIAQHAAQLDSPTAVAATFPGLTVDDLVTSAAAARQFAEANRTLLRIPTDRGFDILPPVVASRSFDSRRAGTRDRQLVFRVRWDEAETHDLGTRFSSRWAVKHGTTLVVDAATGKTVSCLTTATGEQPRAARRAALNRWADEGRLLTAEEATGPDGQRRPDRIVADARSGVMHVTGSGRTLHINGDDP